MRREERKQRIKEIAMKLVATQGLEALAMKEIAKSLNVRESTLYRDFETLDALVAEAYLDFCQEIVAFTQNISIMPLGYEMPKETMVQYAWFNYLRFLVDSDYKMVFFIRVRNTRAYEHLHEQEKRVVWESPFFRDFRAQIFDVLHIQDAKLQHMVWFYIDFYSMYFAERIISGDIPDVPETYEYMKILLFKGIEALGES